MDLVCYVYPGWRPRIRAASPRREWMDASPESFAYRCLPLNIANAHGWEILSPCGFEAVWNGGPDAGDVEVRPDPGTPAHEAPVALFGQGTFTIHVQGLFRTSPGCNLWVGGPPNRAKDGIAPLGGVIETDWAPYTFTMNWRFTRPNLRVRFEENEPVCFIFPLPRDLLDGVVPRIAPIDEEPELKRRFERWSCSRDRFQAEVAAHPPASPGAKWQKFYYRGTDADGAPVAADHRAKLRLAEFAGSEAFLPAATATTPACPAARATAAPVASPPPDAWPATQEPRHAPASPPGLGEISRRRRMPADEFLDRHYAANRPLLLAGEMDGWPALQRWHPDYLAAVAGARRIDAPAGVADAPTTLADFIARARQPPAMGGGPPRLVADLSMLPALAGDLRGIDRLLAAGPDRGRLWLEAAGSGTAPRPESANRLLLQLVGRRRIVLAAPGETGKLLAVARHEPPVDLAAPDLAERLPELRGLQAHVVWLEPGEALFVPRGWWRQVAVAGFSASVERDDFLWPDPGRANAG